MTPQPRRVRVVIDEATIARRIDELALAIKAAEPHDLLVVAVLKGSFMFAADLIRALHRVGLAPQVEFMHLSSYRKATVSSGQVSILRDVESEVRGRDVLSVLLEKPGKRAVTIDADFVGFTCPDLFVVGYGMDVAHSFRQLPFVGLVEYGEPEPDLFDRA